MQILIERFLGPAAAEKRFLSNIFFEKNFEKQNFNMPPDAADPLPGLIYYTFILLVVDQKKNIYTKYTKTLTKTRESSSRVGL